MKFRKKPVVIEAEQFIDDRLSRYHPTETFMHWPVQHDGNRRYLLIPTLEGPMTATHGDWIIKGVKGEFYPCKPDIFAATYESVEGVKMFAENAQG